MINRIIKTLLVLLIVSMIAFFTALGMIFYSVINEAKAKAVASITVTEPSSSKRADCEEQQKFAVHIIRLRERGTSRWEVTSMVMSRVAAAGLPQEVLAPIGEAIDRLWIIPGTAEEIGEFIRDVCIRA